MSSLLRDLGALAENAGQRENQLSRTFAAVFNNSASVRGAVVPFLLERFGLRPPTDPVGWFCKCEKKTRSGDGRLDLILSPLGHDHLARRREVIVLENKLDSKLTREQLLKYRPQHAHIGVITARFPEVSAAWLRSQRIPAFRWHELHKLLLTLPSRGGQRWLTAEFISYLEDLGMASRGLTRKDLLGIQRTFALLGGPAGWYKVHDLRFERAAVAKAFVEDVADAFKDAVTDHAVRIWGPGYGKEDHDDDEGVVHEFTFWARSRKNRGTFPCVGYSLTFPQKMSAAPYAWAGLALAADADIKSYYCWTGAELFDRQGRLREDEHIRQVTRVLRRLVRHL